MEISKNLLVLHQNYLNLIDDIKVIKKTLPQISNVMQIDLDSFKYPLDGQLAQHDFEISKVKLLPNVEIKKMRAIYSYDESILKFSCLEGDGYLIAHSLVALGEADYEPIGLLTFNFYTRSKSIASQSEFIKFSLDTEMDSKKDYILDRIKFLSENVPDNALLLIDGPLIGGDVYTYMIKSIKDFTDRGVIPIFFVKNSNSNLVSDNIKNIYMQFNSDMHWAYEYLNRGERTNYFFYEDKHNEKNAKVFCYLKAFDKSPQRIEIAVETFELFKDEVSGILDLIYYLLLVQGEKNPQVRSIAIAEKFAREFIKVSDMYSYFNKLGLTPTMNEDRFKRG